MRLRTLIRCSGSAAAIMLAAAPAWAQEGGTPGAEAQQAPAAEDDEIVISGYRQSLETQQNIRRNSTQIVDAIVAQDIGKLPDITVSDTAARIPGVQVERSGGEAGRVLVRGLPDFVTTYNGREIFTAETRSVALQDFPSGAIGAIEVYKTSTANLVEPGLAGLINVRSRRPFDFADFHVAGSAWMTYTYQARDYNPNANIMVSDRWDVGGGEIGALLGLSYTSMHYRDSTRSNTDFVAGGGPNGTRFPDIQRVTYDEGDRERPSVNAAIQWRPAPGLEFYAEGLYQGFRNKLSSREMEAALWGGSGFSNVVTVPDRPDLLESATVTNPRRVQGFQGGTYNKTDTYQFAVGGSFETGGLKITADVARTDSTFTGSTASIDYAFANPQTIVFDTNADSGDGGAVFSIPGFDAGNPANYIYRGFYEEAQQAEGKDWQARVDVTYETGMPWLTAVEAGVRYTDRDAHREFGNRYWDLEGSRLPFSAVPLDYQLSDSGFRGANPQPGILTWLSPTYDSIRNNLVRLRQFNQAVRAPNFGPNTDQAPTADPQQTWDANEKHFSAYGQLRYEIPLGGDASIDGTVGLRYVRSDLDLTGTRLVFPAGGGAGVQTPTDVERKFEDWLPNVNARIRITPQFQARLAYTETQTRPNFIDLRASGVIDQPPSCLNNTPRPENCFLTGNGGNPFLNPLTSQNYDAALEYYFSRNGFISASVFQRDLEGFVAGSVYQGTTGDGTPLRLSSPINSGAGRIRGFEIQGSTFLDFIGLSSFGVQANATYLESKAEFTFDAGANTQGVQQTRTTVVQLPGISDWSYNLSAFYEANGLSARLSYNWRNDFLITYQDRGDHIYEEYAEPVSRLDLSVNYDVIPALTVFADWTNILGDPFKANLKRTDLANGVPTGFVAEYPRVVRYEESTLTVGIRFRL
jgi:iron complex outermembrane receptor protein